MRVASLVLSTTMLAAVCAAVPAHAEPLKAEVIHWWTSGGESAAIKVFAEAYNAAGGEWIDTAIAGGQNARAAAINRVVGGNPPTAMQFNTSRQFDDIVEQGLLNDVEEVANAEGWKEFLPTAFLKAITRDGKIYAVPVNVHGQNWMWTSTAAFEKAGVATPKTWDEFLPAMAKLKDAGIIPIALGGQPWQEHSMFNTVLLGVGGADLYYKILRDIDAEATKTEGFRKTIEMFANMRQYVDAGSPGRNWNDATSMLITGKAGVQFMGDWAKGEFINAGLTAGKEYDCLLPGNPGYMIGGDVFVMAKTNDPQQIAAQHLLAKVMLSKDAQVGFNKMKGSIPVRTDVDAGQLDKCAQTGLTAMKDPAAQVPAIDLLMTADGVGQVRDLITEFWNTPSMSNDDMIERFGEVLASLK
jgi:glucose/mannose transport system substrate-binding protein